MGERQFNSESISEKKFIQVNGVRQGMFIKGKDINNPVILFLHGGPGMPEYPLTQKYQTNIESHFTVCWWEQRGASLSYHRGQDYEAITINQLVEDTKEVARFLQEYLNKDKIILLGHSFGTYIGILAAQQAPELFHSYVGMAQVTSQLESEKIAYNYMIERVKGKGDKRLLKKLKSFDIRRKDYIPQEYLPLRNRLMHRFGIGTMYQMNSVFQGLVVPIMKFRGYSLREKITLWKANQALQKHTNLRREVMNTNLSTKVKSVEVPLFLFHGSHDFTVNYQLAKSFFKEVEAPVKGFYTFTESAHSPIFEEPERFMMIMITDVLNQRTDHVDSFR